MRAAWGLGVAGGILVGWGCGAGAFACQDDAQCSGGASGGVCAEGYCAFPIDEAQCASGLRWGEHAGGLANTCVPAAGETDPTDSASPTSTSQSDPTTSGSLSATDEGPLEASDDGSEGPGPGVVELHDDALAGEFGAGTLQDVEWTGDRLALTPGATVGTFTSRVFDADGLAQWQTAQWMPLAPYAKPLLDDGGSEAGYEDGNVSMEGNVLLMHMDGEGPWSDGTEVLDASGAGSHGVLLSDGDPAGLVPGVFGTALDDHVDSRISIPTARAPALAFGEDDFTWSLWFRMDDPCTQNHVYMGVDNSDFDLDVGPHLWLGCTDDAWDECSAAAEVAAPRAGGVFRSQHSNGSDGGNYCSTSTIDGDQWHHLAVVKQGHDRSQLRFYVDGTLEYEGPASFAGPHDYPDSPDFTIGAFSRGTYPAVGVFDEAAVWRRALSADEVAAVYQRGAAGLQLRVRVCELPGCADDPPWGPALLDPPQALDPGSELPLVGLPEGRFVQYELTMTGDGQGAAPSLRSVTVRGLRL